MRRYNKVSKTYGIYPLVCVVASFRCLVYGHSKDSCDEMFHMSETKVDKTFKVFCKEVVDIFGDSYLNRCPDENNKVRCLRKMEQRGFPGCFASWDCKHFCWQNCPVRLAGQHLGKQSLLFLSTKI